MRMRRICSTALASIRPTVGGLPVASEHHPAVPAPVYPCPGLAGPDIADAEILEFVFYRRVDAGWSVMDMLADLPHETALQRVYEAHLRSGGHWLTRTGAGDGSPGIRLCVRCRGGTDVLPP